LGKYNETVSWVAWNPDLFPVVFGTVQRAIIKQSYYLVYFIQESERTLRPRYGAGWKSALAASLAWGWMSSMQSAKWVVLLEITPSTVITPFIATLPAIVMASLAGAWFYEK
jgi:hypothetical protein